MDSRDEELTLENVDELVEQYLSRPQALQPPTRTSLTHVVHNLQSIYEEERLEQAWTRINNSISGMNSGNTKLTEGLDATQPVLPGKMILPDTHKQNFNIIQHRSGKQSPLRARRKKWYSLAVGLVAAILLITFLIWPMLSYTLHNSKSGSAQFPTKTVTPSTQPTVSTLNMKEYADQNFKIQCPASWVITSTNTGGQGSYLSKVQFHPAETSSVFVNIDKISNTNSSTKQLLLMDPDVKLGMLRSTSSATYNGLVWTVGIVELTGPSHISTAKLEVAYSNQGSPYRIEFGATPDMFNSYAKVFNAMLASFSVQKTGSQAVATVMPTITSTAGTPTIRPTATPLPASIPTPSPTAVAKRSGPSIKIYSDLYFTIQYPADWVITNVTPGGLYQQTVQFRPSATSPIIVNVNVLYSSDLSSNLLLLIDPVVKLGTLLTTNTVTYNGLAWTVGTVNLLGSAQTPASELEIAYSNQNTPYKIEFSAPSDMFSSYTTVFNNMLASFSPAS